ncbi:SDR family NAD(P)-dependent oxidoreductase [Microbacterium sp. 18062]|uniref:SDR family NAD(P)-dependent oxidoreductase n=1 Tax=Microbacterium sp. 18062 TaxID=2681410 RepID=UPI00135A6E09|nr:SDR family oxidoreductase [Microbacterium sp. 18062]
MSGTIVITGAARGQGAAHAELLASAGYRVVITDVLDAVGAETAERLRATGGDVVYRHLDVSDESEWERLADELAAGEPPLRGLVNNAGILRHGPIADTTVDAWELQQRVNVRGTFLGIRALAPLMEADGGSIVNVSSSAGLVGSTGYAAYSASKAAVIGLTRAAAAELAPAVRVNVICPGGVSTSMNDDEPVGGSSSSAPLARRASPAEISPLVAYLLADASSFVTGSVVPIDGGLTAV